MMYGYGILNNHVPTLRAAMGGGGFAFDADAQAFITAASITNTTQKSAINTLVTDLKGYGIWTKMKAIYPFVGGTAITHKWNLKDPRDLDAAYRLTFFGGGTHTSDGYVMNGTDSYATTFFNPSLITGWKDNHNLSIYMKTQTPTGTGWHLGYGNTTTGDPIYGLAIRRTVTNDVFYDNGNLTQSGYGRLGTTTTDARGFWSGNSLAFNDRRIFKNGTQVVAFFQSVVGTPPNDVMNIGAMNGTSGSINYYLSGVNAFTSFSDFLLPPEIATYYTAVQKFQTTLNRNV